MDDLDERLFELVLQRYKGKPGGRPTNWYGRRGGSSQRKWVCYICDEVIATESALYPQTNHAARDIKEHRLTHEDLTSETYSPNSIPWKKRAAW